MAEKRDKLTGITPERFELLVQSVTDYAIYMLDPSGIVSSWNAGAQRFKGYTQDEILGQHFSRFYTPEDLAIDLPTTALHKAEHEGRFEAEGWRVRKDGTRFWANVVIDPVRDADGALVGFAKVTRDLSDRRKAEQALRDSEQRFRLLVESVTDYAIYMLDPAGVVSSWNAGAQRFKGYTADEILGRHFSTFYTEEDKVTELPKRALHAAEHEGRFEAEGWRMRKDGTRFWASVVIDPVRDPSGRLIGFAKITRDLTERRESQKALEQAQEAFFQSQKMEAVGKLTGGVAHDFNNLLAAIVGSIDLARNRLKTGGDVTRFLDNAMKAAERGAALTQRMLAFARKQDLALEAVDLAGLVRGMADLMQRTLGGGVTVETRFPLVLRPVRADPRQLELVLLNLAVNARDAMSDGGKITIAAREAKLQPDGSVAGGDYICLSVTDHGEGMDADTLARAMEPFFTTKGVGKGTGLGLSMAHGMAEQSGGRLVLRSAKGEGTTAEIWLPMADAATARAAERAEAKPAASAGTLAILAVDDDPLVLTNTAAILEDLGHQVSQAPSGREALRLLAEHPADLVITDYAMPEMTGAQLAEAIEAGWPGTPVLMISGYAELPPGAGAALPKLAKPFRADQLARAITDTLEARRKARVVPIRKG